MGEKLRGSFRKMDKNNVLLFAVSALIFLVVSIANAQTFLSSYNLRSMGGQMAEFGFFAIAMMISFLSGGIDISIVGVANLVGVSVGFMFAGLGSGYEGAVLPFIVLAFLVAVIMGAAMGALNGFLIARFQIPPMLVTLGTSNLYMGIAVIITQAKTIVGFPEAVADFGNGGVGIFSVPLVLFVLVAALTAFILNRTRFGHELRFYGANPKATAFSGIDNRKVIVKTYMYCAIISAIAGAMMVMRVNSARANFGTSYMFTSILCVILGGISPMGGKGRVSGVVLSLVALQLLSSGLNMMGVSAVLKDFIWGALLLVVMSLNFFTDRKKLTKKMEEPKGEEEATPKMAA